MEKCNQCGKTLLLPKRMDNVALCSSCASLINYSDWIDRLFGSKEELIKKEEEIISLASNKNYKKEIISVIERYFNEFINEKFITAYNGKSGQKIYVFDEYCIIKTENKTVQERLVSAFSSFDPKLDELKHEFEEDNELYDNLSFTKNLLSKGSITAGITSAISLGMKKIEEEQREEKRENDRQKLIESSSKKISRQIIIGNEKLFLDDFSKVEIVNSKNSSFELLKFVPNGVKSNDIYECKYFFINVSNLFKAKQIRQKVESIRDIINGKIHNKVKKGDIVKTHDEDDILVDLSTQNDSKKEIDSFSQIREYKKLLDEGIISEEEFDKKKKELLNL